MFSNSKLRFYSLSLLLILLAIFIGCRKNQSLHEKSIDHHEVSDTQLLYAAQKFYAAQKNVPLADGVKEQRPVDYLIPDWKSAKYTKNSRGERIIGVALTSASFQYNELNVVVKDGIAYGVIKRFTEKDGVTNLVVVSPAGQQLGTLSYSTKGGSKGLQIKRGTMSIGERRSPLFSSTEEPINGGELEEVVITPTGGGQLPTPIVFPPAPVSNPPAGSPPVGTMVASEPDASDGGWDNSIQYQVQRQYMPKLAAFKDAFPNLPAGEVYDLIGGEIKAARLANPSAYGNACALRVSRALNYTTVQIPEMPGITLKGKDGKNYIVKVGDLEAFLKKAIGTPQTKLSFPSKATAEYNLNNVNGIYIMRASYPAKYGATGHASYVNNAARSDLDYDAKGGVASISVWNFSTQ